MSVCQNANTWNRAGISFIRLFSYFVLALPLLSFALYVVSVHCTLTASFIRSFAHSFMYTFLPVNVVEFLVKVGSARSAYVKRRFFFFLFFFSCIFLFGILRLFIFFLFQIPVTARCERVVSCNHPSGVQHTLIVRSHTPIRTCE